jgi:chromosome segregation ATPase
MDVLKERERGVEKRQELLKTKWLLPLTDVVSRISDSFSEMMEEIGGGCKGCVKV